MCIRDRLNAMRDVFNDRRKFMIGRIREIEGLDLIVPDGAFYIMLVVKNLFGKRFGGRKINGSLDVADMLLEKGVAVVDVYKRQALSMPLQRKNGSASRILRAHTSRGSY